MSICLGQESVPFLRFFHRSPAVKFLFELVPYVDFTMSGWEPDAKNIDIAFVM
jgi:hypothetical protein